MDEARIWFNLHWAWKKLGFPSLRRQSPCKARQSKYSRLIRQSEGGEPVPARLENVRTPPFLGVRGAFFRKTFWRSK
jgi:hypothetical protein